MKFEKYHISSTIKDNLSKLGFKRPTDIQYKSIPAILKGEECPGHCPDRYRQDRGLCHPHHGWYP